METVNIITQTYQEIKKALTEKLINLGYQPVHEQHDDQLFHSCYMIWSNNIDALRLTWDGKERWFALEVTEDLPLKALSTWSSIIIMPVDANNKSTSYLEGIIHSIVNALD